MVDVLDNQNIWRVALISEITDSSKNEVKMSFYGWK